MASFSDEMQSRYSAFAPTGATLTKWQNVLATAAACWAYFANDGVLTAPAFTACKTIHDDIVAVLDAAKDKLNSGSSYSLTDTETLLEALRTDIYNNARSDQRSYVDPNKIGSVSINSGVSITITYGAAGMPFTAGAFAQFRYAVRYAFGCGTDIGVPTPPGTYPVS